MFSSENAASERQGDHHHKNQNTKENTTAPVDNLEEDSSSDTITKAEHISLLSKSTIKSFSRFLPRNVVGTIGRKTSLLTRRTLRSGRGSLRTLNQNWDTLNSLSSFVEGDTSSSMIGNSHSQEDVITKRKQQLRLQKNYTLRLSKFKDKFKTKRHSKKDRFGSLHVASPDRFRKDLNQSKIESNNKQAKLLEKLLEKHNKHLESL
ncbi:uncharacterized protein LOC129951936 [Eupeodes corollae]|uniref:uncharacterized protein LOC129951936 n=1 Tax=Eupeodes corollae TaxID=290404 RepID=UPI002491BCB9|nr:uncharacterized protein LOC129951936 [Eupeodes corollae]